jgi:hypothetical protein
MPNKRKKTKEPHKLFDAVNHATIFEVQLVDFLTRQCTASNVTLADIKDIVWNEQDNNLVSRVVFELAEQNPKTKFEDILQIINDAWNHFPHKRLNGLAPRDMIERINIDKNFTYNARPDFYTLFAERFPRMPGIVRQRDNEWSWEYPASFHTERTELSTMREKDGELENEEEEEGFDSKNIGRELSRKVSVMAAKACFDNNPLQFDAAVMIAVDAIKEGQGRIAKGILESSISEGRKMFPPEFSPGIDHLPWGFIDNRPFLLILGEHAILTEEINGSQKAIPLYEELLALNPNDNQGIREILATAYLKTNRLDELLKLDKKYPDDFSPGLSVGALLALYKLGRFDEALARIVSSRKHFGHIFQEILKTNHPKPDLIPGRVQVGGDDEAWFYWESQGTFWMSSSGARDFLRKNI